MSATHQHRATDRAQLLRITRRLLVDEYGLEPRRLRPRPPTFNQMVRADLADGSTVAVRIGSAHRIHPVGVERVEQRWLDHLADRSPKLAPRMLADRLGRGSVPIAEHQSEPPRLLTVFSWVPGRRLPKPVGPASAQKLGALAAQLHRDAPAVAVPPAWQRLCRAEDPITFGPRDGLARWPGADRSLLTEAQARCRAVLDDLWEKPPHPPHLLHGDLGPHNVLAHDGALHPVDFQDLLWGFDVQDLGLILADLARAGTSAAAIESFRTGYEEERPWPLTDPALADALEAGRSLNLLNLGLTVDGDDSARHLTRHLLVVRRWMAT